MVGGKSSVSDGRPFIKNMMWRIHQRPPPAEIYTDETSCVLIPTTCEQLRWESTGCNADSSRYTEAGHVLCSCNGIAQTCEVFYELPLYLESYGTYASNVTPHIGRLRSSQRSAPEGERWLVSDINLAAISVAECSKLLNFLLDLNSVFVGCRNCRSRDENRAKEMCTVSHSFVIICGVEKTRRRNYGCKRVLLT